MLCLLVPLRQDDAFNQPLNGIFPGYLYAVVGAAVVNEEYFVGTLFFVMGDPFIQVQCLVFHDAHDGELELAAFHQGTMHSTAGQPPFVPRSQ